MNEEQFFGGIFIMVEYVVLSLPFCEETLFYSIFLIITGEMLIKLNVLVIVDHIYTQTDLCH